MKAIQIIGFRIFWIGILGLLMVSCESKKSNDSSTSPDYINQTWEMTRDPLTNKPEGQRLWSYLLSQRNTMGRSSLDKARIYNSSWSPVDDFFANLAIQRIVFDPSDTKVFYFCTGEGWNNADASRGAGVWKSTDGGDTWLQLPSTLNDSFYYCHDMLVHPVTRDVYVCTRYNGLLRSQDGGDSWTQVLGAANGSIQNSTTDIDITVDNELVVCIGNFNTDGIYFSENGNAGEWEKRITGMPTEIRRIVISTAPSNADFMYAIPLSSITADSNRIHGVYKSTDKGLNWTKTELPGGDRDLSRVQGWFDLIVKVDPNDENVVLVGGLNVFRTRDGGENWQQLFEGRRRRKTTLQYVHVDQHEILFKDSDTVLFGNDGGIYRSNNMQADTPLLYIMNDNYNVTQFYSCAAEGQKGATRIIGGTQDNGSIGSTSGGISSFEQLSWADGSYCNINQSDPDVYFTTTQYQRIYRFRNGLIDTISNPALNSRNTRFINPIEMDPNNSELLYQLSSIGLWRMDNASFDSKDDWTMASRSFGAFTSIGISTSPANVAFIGRISGGRVYRIENCNQTDQDYFPINCDPKNQLPVGGYANCVVVDPKDANHVLVIYSNYGVESIWESSNALSESPDWESQEGNLPDIPIYWGVLNPDNSKVCYLGTQAGVMMTTQLDSANTNWTLVTDGLANLKVNMLRLRKSDKTLIAATHGRGIFSGKIKDDYTVEWEERGPMNVGGRTRTLMFDPNDATGKRLWAGSVSGGLWSVGNYDSVATYYEEVIADFKVRVGPNPLFRKNLGIFILTNQSRNVLVELFDVNGKLVEKEEYNVEYGEHKLEFDMNRARSGIYFLRVKSGGEEREFRLIKER
jgi:photosystem II stability/assembly factor-like uncharacterized protein